MTCWMHSNVEQLSSVGGDLVCLLQKCRRRKDAQHAKRLSDYLLHCQPHLLQTHTALGNHLVPLLVECRALPLAQQVFDRLPHRNVYSWTSLISGYVDSGQSEIAMSLYHNMQQDHTSPNNYTFVVILKACTKLMDAARDKELHADIVKFGLERDLFVANTLVDMYGKCGSLTEAHQVLMQLPVRDVVSWNALIGGCVEHGQGQVALNYFEQMQQEGICATEFTFASILKACGTEGASDMGNLLCADIVKKGFERDLFIGSTMVDMYVKSALLAEAHKVFDMLPVQDAVTWTALIAGYAEHGLGEQALDCFEQMQQQNVPPAVATLSCSLKACGIIGALEKGQNLHCEVIRRGCETDPSVATSLVDMYGKCGSLAEAEGVFKRMPVQDVVSWNALIKGYGENHEGYMAIKCFEEMQKQGLKPNATTFTCLLAACSHSSLVFKGQEYFKVMIEHYGIEPTVDHHLCMVDLLARSGHVKEAHKAVEAIQWLQSEDVLRALLTACKIHGDVGMGLKCFEQLVQVNHVNATAYMIMAQVCASTGLWNTRGVTRRENERTGGYAELASAL